MPLQKILVDTDILIWFLMGRVREKDLLERAAGGADLYISVVTIAELMAGMRPAEEIATERLLGGLEVIAINESIARTAGRLRRHRKKVLLPDCLIGATAVEEKCLLLTGNRKDYPFDGIRFYS